MLNYLAISSVPIMILVVIIVGLKEKLDVYSLFIQGALEGLEIIYKIFPYILGITVAIGLFKSSNALNILIYPVSNILDKVGIPKDIVPLMFLRPLSGGASMALVMDIFKNSGVDSVSGKIASVIMGGTETTIYTISILFAAGKIKTIRGTLIAGLLADISGMLVAVILVRIGMI